MAKPFYELAVSTATGQKMCVLSSDNVYTTNYVSLTCSVLIYLHARLGTMFIAEVLDSAINYKFLQSRSQTPYHTGFFYYAIFSSNWEGSASHARH